MSMAPPQTDDARTDDKLPTETVPDRELPAICTAPDCNGDPQFAWREDGDLWTHRAAGYVTPCVCASCREDVPPAGLSATGEWVRVRPVATDGGDPDA